MYIGTHYESKQKGIHRDNLNAVKANLRKINYYKHGVFMKQYESLKECYDDLKDENAKHVLGLLKKHYPDYFSNKETAISNLKKLSNIDEILKVLENVRKEKDKIKFF